MSTLRNAVTRRRGMVLIIVLSVLAVMAILGISLLTLTSLDRTVADNHIHYVQARQMAKSGVEDAMARLREGGVLRSAFEPENEWQYRGNDLDGKDESKRLVPVAWGLLPSFPKKGANGLGEMVELWRDDQKATVRVGVSGTSAGRFHSRSNIYSVEVRDLSSCIYLNDGVHLYGANNSSVSQNLKRILNRLGESSKVGIGQLGDLVLRLRPSTGFGSMQDFRTLMKTKGNLKDVQLDRLERYVTTVAWIDKNVVNPAPLSHATIKHYPVTYERGGEENYMYRRGPGRDNENDDRSVSSRLGWMPDFGGITGAGGVTTKIYAQDEMYPTYIEVTHRAPVNVNTAEEPVLIALLADLKGFYILEKRSGAPFGGDSPDGFNYNYLWPDGTLVDSAGKHKKGTQKSWSANKGWFTFENMGHTYSDRAWKARTYVNDQTEWYEPFGATSNSTSSSFEMVEDHDALGELWITPTLQSGDGSGTIAGGVSARSIAQEIIACRNKSGRYANAPFGGPFRNWAQFYAFCDSLVEVKKDGEPGAGILRDERVLKPEQRRQASQALADLLKANFNPNFTPNETNPDHNLYLMVDKTDLVVNSTEFCFLPTGLFSVTSVGRVIRDRRTEDDLRKTDKDSGSGPQEIVAQSRFDAVVRAYNVYRETSQRHFYSGDATPAQDATHTNNALTVETGPEPDNGPLLYLEHLGHGAKFIRHTPDVDDYAGDSTIDGEVMSGWGYEASGYMALPTTGGMPTTKRKGELLKNTENGPEETAWDTSHGIAKPAMRASFRLNDSLDFAKTAQANKGGDKAYLVNAASTVLSGGGNPDLSLISEYVYNPATCSGQVITRQAGGSAGKPRLELTSNFADPGEEGVEGDGGIRLSPYDPTDGTRYRLARSFRLPLSSSPGAVGAAGKTMTLNQGAGDTATLPRMLKAAPSDLHVDGFYVERNAGLAYWLDEGHSVGGEDVTNFSTYQSTASFWFKPGFDPAYTGKVRSIASASRYHRKNFYYRNPSPMTLYFMPADGSGDGTSYTTAGQIHSPGWSTATAFSQVHAQAKQGMTHLTSLPRASLVFQIAYSAFDGAHWGYELEPDPNFPGAISLGKTSDVEAYSISDNLNKKALGKVEDDRDALRAHRWVHITMSWRTNKRTAPLLSSGDQQLKVIVNGLGPKSQGNNDASFHGVWKAVRDSGLNHPTNYTTMDSFDKRARFSDTDFFEHEIGPDGSHKDERFYFTGDRHPEIDNPEDRMWLANTFRLGETSTHSFMPDTFCRNFSSDGTYDEFYFWLDGEPAQMGDSGLASMANPKNLAGKKFAQGRYHVPGKSDEDALWTSPELVLKGPIGNRELAGPTKNVVSGIKADKPSGVGMTTTEGMKSTVRLLGVAWTWYAEKYNSEVAGNTLGGQIGMVPVMVDYQDPASPTDLRQTKACARLYVTANEVKYPMNDPEGMTNDGFSSIQDQSGQAVYLNEEGRFRYHVRFKIEGTDGSTVLLSTPVLDDVTFYYLTPGTPFLQYVERNEIE